MQMGRRFKGYPSQPLQPQLPQHIQELIASVSNGVKLSNAEALRLYDDALGNANIWVVAPKTCYRWDTDNPVLKLKNKGVCNAK
jgi:hypothetical protein